MVSKHRITVNLSDDEYVALTQLAQREKVSKAWLGRRAITSLLRRTESDERQMPLPLPRQRGKVSQ
jgi:predicted transcriptional regulator